MSHDFAGMRKNMHAPIKVSELCKHVIARSSRLWHHCNGVERGEIPWKASTNDALSLCAQYFTGVFPYQYCFPLQSRPFRLFCGKEKAKERMSLLTMGLNKWSLDRTIQECIVFYKVCYSIQLEGMGTEGDNWAVLWTFCMTVDRGNCRRQRGTIPSGNEN